jgi:probable HAF family extracellular repeat protein
MKEIKVILTAVFLMAASTLVLAQGGTYTQIDVPGASDTWGGSIDNAGDIDGYYLGSDSNYHGFLLSNGTYTTIDYPGAAETFPGGINNGQIAGYAISGTEPESYYGFVYNVATQTFTTISDPKSNGATEPCCITNTGVIGGTVYPSNGPFAFVLQNSTYHLLVPPGTVTSSLIAITADNEIFLSGTTSSQSTLYFSYSKGTYTQITLPSKLFIFLDGVNPQGTLYVGPYQTNEESSYGYIYNPKTENFVTLEFPGVMITNAFDMNKNGEVVGLFTDNSNHTHAFTWTPATPGDKAN